ncbi:MAG: AAA family ATPase [Flexilinea sp.]|nr:AAA family ATPase [Flexilinea sp.]
MGIYLNPGNEGFRQIVTSEYVDKSGLIAHINHAINTTKNLICISRPRRFGKSYAARMLCAYYDRSCDSAQLFSQYQIAQDPSFLKHLNHYHVISLDISGFISEARIQNIPLKDLPWIISNKILKDVISAYPDLDQFTSLNDCLIELVNRTKTKIIFIIDEWDAVIRETQTDEEAQNRFFSLLRGWFKNSNFTPGVIAAAYMTGILPIKKDGSQSAISDFEEYTMIKPRKYGQFVGFTEREVAELCRQKDVSFTLMKQWYDGYTFKDVGSVYNPNSVMKAVRFEDFDSYWTESSAAESLMKYISQDYNGFTKTIAELVGGVDVQVNTKGFANDLTTFRGKDDVLTLLIHLGYLSYNSENSIVRIPNEEIRLEFQKSIREVHHTATLERLKDSDQLFIDTLQGNETAVAKQIEKIHSEETSPLHYNKEDSLRSVIKLAYYTYKDHYLQWEELPSGVGYADIVYLPKKDSDWPALVIELKWNQSAEGAIDQIYNRNYPDVLKNYGSDILLVGINYDKSAPIEKRRHTCKIVRI